MPLRLLASLSLLLAALSGAGAQTADDFFHGGALSYLSNNIPGALETVTNGLQRFPDDPKLKKLYELLNQQQQQNQQNQKDQKQDQKQDDKKDNQSQQQQAKNDQQKKEEQKKQQEKQDKQDQQKRDQQQTKSGDQSRNKPENKPGESQQVNAHAMTPQEAKQLLDAQKGDEKVLQFVPQDEPKNQGKKLKDW
jgi:Mg-chelatase subunit ChlI